MSTDSDWYLDVGTRANLLVIGPDDPADAFLKAIRPRLQEPVAILRGGEPLALPPRPVGTLILINVWALTPDEQRQLNRSLEERFRGAQVISTSPICLMPMIAGGNFLESLYYRLNAIYIDVRASPSSVFPRN